MNPRRRLRFHSLLILLALLSGLRLSLATGIEDPTRWLGLGSSIALDSPEFFFEVETKRIGNDLHSQFKANVPPGFRDDRDYAKQTNEIDAADFEDALKTGAIHPPDAEKALASHKRIIELIGRKTESENPDNDSAPTLPSDNAASTTPSVTPVPSPPAVVNMLNEEFASEFADYHRGALAYHAGEKEAAQSAWQGLLNRPLPERKYRTTWAEYMLGKMALENDKPEEARSHFHNLRNAARNGAIDSLGLAVTSLGWEGQIELKAEHFAEAAHLYLEQRGAGDPTATNSLHALMNELIKAQPDLAVSMSDPLLQRLTTAAALCGIGAEDGFTAGIQDENKGNHWLEMLEKADAKQVKDADCVAWMEYQKGDYKAAERWLKLAEADSPYTLWLKAKLALREGKLDVAAQFLSRALPKIAPQNQLEMRSLEYETMPADMSKGDLGAIKVGRADFVAAAKLFLQVRNCDDAEYLAEGVMTLPELKKFIEELPEKQPAAEDNDYDSRQDDRRVFTEIVGRRLARAGKFSEARQYFDQKDQETLDEYVDLLKKSNDSQSSKADRAKALWEAAQLIDGDGGSIFDYDLPEVMGGRLTGREVMEPEAPSAPSQIAYGKPVKKTPPVTGAEMTRLKSNIVPAVHRHHSAYIAADLGWRAAQLMPDNDALTAFVLNTAGSWLKHNDDKAADRFYQAIERRCSKTELGQKAVKRHWFVPLGDLPSDEN